MIYDSVYYLKWEVFLDCITFILLTAPQRRCYQWPAVFAAIMCPPLPLQTNPQLLSLFCPLSQVRVWLRARRLRLRVSAPSAPRSAGAECRAGACPHLPALSAGVDRQSQASSHSFAHPLLRWWERPCARISCVCQHFFFFNSRSFYWSVEFDLIFFKTWEIC